MPQEKQHSSKEIILNKAQPSKTDSLINANNAYWKKEDAMRVSGVDPRSVSDEEKILSELQEEKQTLEGLNVNMSKYLPSSPDLANIQESSEENGHCSREDFSRDEGYFTSLGSLPSNLQPQAYKNAMENIRSAKNMIRKLIYLLYESIELTYQSKQGSKDQHSLHKALFELWIKWNRSQSEKEDGDTQLLEIWVLGMSRSIALKLQSAFLDLMTKVQYFPSGLQDKIQQACSDMQDIHNTFSLSNRFKELDKYDLTKIQFKLTKAQGSIEELFCILENIIPSVQSARPLSPSAE